MEQKYIPILKAKLNEFKALENTSSLRNEQFIPMFEVPNPDVTKVNYKKAKEPITNYLDGIISKISGVRKNKYVFIDGYEWFDKTYTETHEHVFSYSYRKLNESGVLVIPVVGYDRWDIPDYKTALSSLNHDGDYLIRLDNDAIEDSLDEDYFISRIDEMLNALKARPSECGVMMDFGDVCKSSIADIMESASRVLDTLLSRGFKYYVIAGCSVPSIINEAVKEKDSCATILRKEMIVWRALIEDYKSINLLLGDYGVRGPRSAMVSVSPDTNGKIRYTMQNGFYISRGHSQREPDKWGQMREVSRKIVTSGYFLGEDFSWGDKYILDCSKGLVKTGNAAIWIAVDTNHHVAFVLAEIAEAVVAKTVPVASPVTSK